MDHQVGQSTSLNPGQVLATTTLSTMPTLAYEEVIPSEKRTKADLTNDFPSRGDIEDEVLILKIRMKYPLLYIPPLL